MSPKKGARVVGYVRVSTAEQADSGAGLAAQRLAIETEAERRGWELVTVCEDAGISGKRAGGKVKGLAATLEARKGLAAAVGMLEAGAADALVASKVDRLSRSLLDFCELMERAQSGGWALVALDAGFDMSTPQGRAMVRMLGVFAELERDLISQRTKDGLAAKRAAGVKVGRPRNLPDRVVNRIRRERAAGASLTAIADRLTDDAIPTSQGGQRWHASTVRAVLATYGDTQ